MSAPSANPSFIPSAIPLHNAVWIQWGGAGLGFWILRKNQSFMGRKDELVLDLTVKV